MKRVIVLLTASFLVLSLYASLAHASTIVAGISSGYSNAGYGSSPTSTSNGSTSNFYGPIEPTWSGCSATPTNVTHSTANTSLASYMNAGSTQDVVTTDRTASSITAQASSTIQNVNLLQGLITASKIRAVASSIGTLTDATSNDTGSSIVGLTIAGVPVSAYLGPNTTIQLAGLGYVVINEQNGPYNGYAATSININMIDVHVTLPNKFGVLAGSQIVVAHAESKFTRTAEPSIVGAHAYGVVLKGFTGSGSVDTSQAVPAEISCIGGDMQIGASSTNLSSTGTTGAVSDLASGQINSSGANSLGHATVSNINLLKGLVQGSMASAVSNAGWNGNGSGSASTTLSNMKVAGVPLSNSPAPNTRIQIPGVGYVVLNEQWGNVNSTGAVKDVNAIDIYITQANVYSVPVGAQIILGYADASATSYN